LTGVTVGFTLTPAIKVDLARSYPSMGKQPHLTTDLVAVMATAAGMPIPAEHLEPATEILEALYELDARLAHLNLDGVIPELRWDARWSIGMEEGQ
jgi:hypothetical protein